jgi:DNA-binding NarL/FixJ family response regulator
MTGLEVATQMQTWPKPPRVLFLSLHDNESYRAATRELGAVGLVGKGNFVADLIPIIADLAADKRSGKTDASALGAYLSGAHP